MPFWGLLVMSKVAVSLSVFIVIVIAAITGFCLYLTWGPNQVNRDITLLMKQHSTSEINAISGDRNTAAFLNSLSPDTRPTNTTDSQGNQVTSFGGFAFYVTELKSEAVEVEVKYTSTGFLRRYFPKIQLDKVMLNKDIKPLVSTH